MSEIIHYAPFERPFVTPFSYGGREVKVRSGFLLRKARGPEFDFAEASPLPGHSSETLAEVEGALSRGDLESLPCLRFARDSLSLPDWGRLPVRANALLRWEGAAECRFSLQRFFQEGFSHVKVKLPANGWQALVDVLSEFPSFRYRLDANGTLGAANMEELAWLLKENFLLSRVEYLEEPFGGVWEDEVFRRYPVPLAADESANSPPLMESLLDARRPPDIFIVKPTVLGGLQSLEPLLEKIKNESHGYVVTSALETEVGRRSILRFLSMGKHGVAGISTGHLFEENFLADQALWRVTPGPGEPERDWLASLPWKELP